MSIAVTTGLWSRFRRSQTGESSVRVARRLIDRCVEGYLNISTSGRAGTQGGGHYHDANHYEPLDYPFLLKCLKALRLREDDVVFEIGCGMGRALCLLARRRVARCIGVELSESLAGQAKVNVARLRGRRSPVEVLATDAVFADYSQGTAFYTFNSFGPITLKAVLEQIRMTLAENPRALRIMYVNPLHQEVFEEVGWLRCTQHVRSGLFRMEATCWEYEPALSSLGTEEDSGDVLPDSDKLVAAGHVPTNELVRQVG